MFFNEVFPGGGVVGKENADSRIASKGDGGLEYLCEFPFDLMGLQNRIKKSGDFRFEPLVDFWFRVGEFERVFAELVNGSDCHPCGEVAVEDAVGEFLGDLGVEGHEGDNAGRAVALIKTIKNDLGDHLDDGEGLAGASNGFDD